MDFDASSAVAFGVSAVLGVRHIRAGIAQTGCAFISMAALFLMALRGIIHSGGGAEMFGAAQI